MRGLYEVGRLCCKMFHGVGSFRRLHTLIKIPTIRMVKLITGYDDKTDLAELRDKLEELKQSLLELDVVLDIRLNARMHDREIHIDNGWVPLGRLSRRPCRWRNSLETTPCVA